MISPILSRPSVHNSCAQDLFLKHLAESLDLDLGSVRCRPSFYRRSSVRSLFEDAIALLSVRDQMLGFLSVFTIPLVLPCCELFVEDLNLHA